MSKPSRAPAAPDMTVATLVAPAPLFGALLFAGLLFGAGPGVAQSTPPARAPVTATAPTPATSNVNPLWTQQKVKNYLPHMTWPEVEDLLKRTDMVIIPVGALEQHGRHGPIGTDYLNGTERALLIAQKTDVLVAPILLPGQSPYHMGFPGVITLSSETIQRVYVEAAQSLIHHGFKRILFLTSHSGNDATVRFIVDRINQETPAIAVELGQAAQTVRETVREPGRAPRAAEPRTTAPAKPRPFDRHGGVGETSDSLYLTPNLVDLSAARTAHLTVPPRLKSTYERMQQGDRSAELVFLAEALKAKETGKQSSTREMSDMGQWSELDPATATAARGKAATDRFVADAVAFIDDWKRMRPRVDN
jgi:creatinine amidohydrolase